MKYKTNQIENWIAANFQYKTRKNGREIRINNPFDDPIKPDKGYHLNINSETGHMHDWRPGHYAYNKKNGGILKFISDYKSITIKEAKRELGQYLSKRDYLKNEKEEIFKPDKAERNLELPKGVKFFNEGEGKIKDIAINYLKNRGISLKRAKELGLMWGIDKIVLPYYEYDEIVYWQARSIMSKTFEFPNESVGVVKTQFLYPFDHALNEDVVIIVESLFDAIILGDGALSSGGAYISEKQAKRLRAINPKQIILAPDNDHAGISSISSNCKSLIEFRDRLYYCLPPEIKIDKKQIDWGELGKLRGWNYPRKFIENNLKKLTPKDLLKFRLVSSKSAKKQNNKERNLRKYL